MIEVVITMWISTTVHVCFTVPTPKVGNDNGTICRQTNSRSVKSWTG